MEDRWIAIIRLISLLATLAALSGCDRLSPSADPTPEPTVPAVIQRVEGEVVAEASMQPARWADLRAPSDGSSEVIEVPVQEGDFVSEGTLLIRFDGTDTELVIHQAKAALAIAEARLMEVKAGASPEEIAVTEARLKAAEASIAQAEALRSQLSSGQVQAEVAEARSAEISARLESMQAATKHQQTMTCFDIEVDGKSQSVCPLLGPTEEDARQAMEVAHVGLDAAEAQLVATQQRTWAEIREAEARIRAAAAQRDALQARLEAQKAGSQEERIAVFEADVARAKATLAKTEAALQHMTVRAPFDGVVAELNVNVGDTVTPGAVVVVIATLDRMQARTNDLTELDVVRVETGQTASVTLDALPDQPLAGRVVRVDRQSEDYRGDVTYPVVIELSDPPPELRWGMTGLVEIAVE